MPRESMIVDKSLATTATGGRVFGKMAHSERFSENVAKNISGNKHQPIFSAGVAYFSL